jgi:tetratricopeptide (TPR) repeat protein
MQTNFHWNSKSEKMRFVALLFIVFLITGPLFGQSESELKNLRAMETIFDQGFMDEALDVDARARDFRKNLNTELEKNYLRILRFEYGLDDLDQHSDSTFQELKALKAKWKNPYLLTRVSIASAYYFHMKGECALELNAAKEAKDWMAQIQDDKLQRKYSFFYAQVRANAGFCDGKTDEALAAFQEFEAQKGEKTLEEKFFLSKEMGYAHIQLGSYEEAKKYYRNYLSLLRPLAKKAPNKIGQAYNGLASACYRLDQVDSTLYYARLAKASFSKGKNTASKLVFWTNYTTLLLRLDRGQEALKIALEGNQMLGSNDMKYEAKTLRSIGSCYLALGDAQRAGQYLEKALASARKYGNIEEELNALDDLATFELERGRTAVAYTYLEDRVALGDAWADSLEQGRMQLYLVEYETSKKEADLLKAKQEQSILQLENDKKGIQIVLIIIVALVLVGILIAYLYFSRRIARYRMENERMKLARAQVNPHFLNNAFTSIQAAALQADSLDTVLNLTSGVARFTRLMLESSMQEAWSLKNELEMLEHYALIFTLKFPGKFEFANHTTLDLGKWSNIAVPTAIAQPLIENAFEYAAHADQPFVELELVEVPEGLCLRIRNSVGQGNVLKRSAGEPSRGTGIVKDRLALYNKRNKCTMQFDFSQTEGIALTTLMIRI